MNTKLIQKLFIAIIISHSALAQDITYSGGTSTGSRTKIESSGGNLILDSNEGMFYSAANVTTKTITVINGSDGKGNAYIANAINYKGAEGPTIDINEADGVVTALSASLWQQNLITTTITNSVTDSNATAVVDVNDMRIIYVNNQFSEFKFDSVKADVNATTATIGNTANTTNELTNKVNLTVTNTATVNWNGNSLTLDDHSKLNVAGTMRINSKFITKSGATMNITGNLSATNAVTFGHDMEANFNFTQESTEDVGTTFNSTVTLNSGANWQAAGKIFLNEGSHLTVNEGAKYIITAIESTGLVDKAGRVILNGATLTLNTENAITNAKGCAAALVSLVDSTESSVNVNAYQDFSAIFANQAVISIYLADNVGFHVDTILGSQGGVINIYNFQENMVTTSDTNLLRVENYVRLFDEQGVFLGNATLSNGYITLAIPEPAEWAAIFGALALALAVYRKRK